MNQPLSRDAAHKPSRLARALGLSTATATLFGVVTLPLSASTAVTGLSLLLVLPLAGLATLGVGLAARPALLVFANRPGFSRWACLAATGSAVFALGAYVSNAALVDDPLQRGTVIGYGVSVAAAVLTVVAAHALLRRTPCGGKLDAISTSAFVAGLGLPAAIGLAVLDVSFLSEGYPSFHWLVLSLVLLALNIVARVAWASRRVRLWGGLSLGAFTCWVTGAFLLSSPDVYDRVAMRSTADRRLLLVARAIADRDGDGFAGALGGGDCDDNDARVYPLSATGRDCFGWVGKRPPHVNWSPGTGTSAAAGEGPRVILLITVDALRCDTAAPVFAGEATLCPNLESLAKEGRSRLDARTTYPRTTPAIASLHGAVPYAPSGQKRARLAPWLKAQGRATHAVSTHGMQLPEYIARSFDSVDRSLQGKTSSGSTTTSPEVSDRTRQWLEANRGGPVFVWSHYFDPHSPYVDPPGSRSAIAPATRRYAAEVRRTDAEIARLIREVAALDGSLVVVVTADHGEEFAEHGNQYHGTTLYEAAVRIPMVVWTPTPSLLVPDTDVPGSLAEVAPFLVSVGRHERFRAAEGQFFWVASQGKRLVGFYQGGYKLTYDEGLNLAALFAVETDPGEQRNLFASSPELRERLGRRLTTYLTPGGLAEDAE